MRCFWGELKWKRGEKNWKGKRKITQVIRQTGEGSDKRIRGGERNWKLRRDIDRGQKHQEKYAVKHLFNVFAIFASRRRREQRKHVAEALVFHFGSHINRLEPPH